MQLLSAIVGEYEARTLGKGTFVPKHFYYTVLPLKRRSKNG